MKEPELSDTDTALMNCRRALLRLLENGPMEPFIRYAQLAAREAWDVMSDGARRVLFKEES